MNAQEFFSLQKAYLGVYQELDEEERQLSYGRMMKKSNELADSDDKKKQKRAATIYLAANSPKGPKVKVRKEQVDIYDIILSYLLDEGYAETPEAAEVIMVNMSEEWREDILEESYILEMRKEDKVKGKKKTPLYIEGKRKSILPAEPGSGRKWKTSKPETIVNPVASFGQYRQGQNLGGKVSGYTVHPHGEGGRSRGVKRTETIQQRRKRSPQEGPTPAQRVATKREHEKYKQDHPSAYMRKYF